LKAGENRSVDRKRSLTLAGSSHILQTFLLTTPFLGFKNTHPVLLLNPSFVKYPQKKTQMFGLQEILTNHKLD